MKKSISLVLSAIMIASSLSCATFTGAEEAPGKDTYQIVTTIFPLYDWARQIVGDNENVELTLLLGSGVDLHSYDPTADDIMKVSHSDLFVYVGGESDSWVEGVLSAAANPDIRTLNLVEAMGEDIKLEEIVEGMEHEHDHEHDDEHKESEAHEKEVSTFEDDEVQDRPLSDWAGEWQSGYPYVLDGTLDPGFDHKAESGTMTAKEYKDYYAAGYESNISTIAIDGDTNVITYTDLEGNTCQSEYEYLGYYIQDWSTGTRAAMYRFEAKDKESGAPIFIEFNDHIIEPCKSEHFHLRSSDTSFDDIEDPENKWPTFWPASMDGDEILKAFIGHDHHEEEEEEEEADEHVWLSLRNAQKLVAAMANLIAEMDPDNAQTYEENARTYIEQLAALDASYEEMVNHAAFKTVLFADRFPFRYLVDDYGLDYYAAFSGCSAESEASFETIIFLAEKTQELGLPSVLTIENYRSQMAETVISSTTSKDQSILSLNSMQGTTFKDVEEGATYLGIMEENLSVLEDALN